MHAYVLHGIEDLRYEQADMPDLKPGWVLIEVMAAGICGSDIPRIYETGTYHFPTIPGHEFSGVVRNVGLPEDRDWVGKRVGVFPLIPCRECENCRNEHYEMCDQYDYLGSRRNGGFAEYVAVPIWNLIELPDTVDFAEAAMLEPMAVALHAIRQLPLEKTKSLVIYGAGPIGLMMSQWARIYGVKDIYIVANKAGQVQLAKELGFTNVCNQMEVNALEWLYGLNGGKPVDAAVEGVGRSEVMEQCILSVKGQGTIVTLGNPHTDVYINKEIYWKVLRRQLRIVGTWNSRFATSVEDDWKDCVEMLAEGRIDAVSLVTHNYPFKELMDGLQVMRNKSEFYSKILISKSIKTRMGM
ncbi:MAG: galactitol-1-phosphate 5-dehydrogenase [Clostridia bacterium]|nr:galactitol-1-phosphate 5-dehydrogenase [Clostridia bacterium]